MKPIKYSYVHGTSTKPLLGFTLGEYFDRQASAYPDNQALFVAHQGIDWTYAALKDKVDTLAVNLMRLGLQAGDRIGIWAPNCAEWVLTQFATAKLGLILVNINPAYRLNELEYALKKVGCRALICADQFKSSNYISMLQTLIPETNTASGNTIASTAFANLQWLIQIAGNPTRGFIAFQDLLAPTGAHELEKLANVATQLQFDDPINIQFTSGTTGSPKGATLTHHNILNNAYFIAQTLKLTGKDKVCIPVPLYHCFGMVIGNLACLCAGAAMMYPAPSFDVEATLKVVSEQKCTALYGVPTMFIGMLEHPNFARYTFSSLRTGVMAGSPCPIEVMKRVVAQMHMPEITICYGMTETSPVSFQTTVDDPLDKRVATVGKIHPHTEVKIIDDENRLVAIGVPGELCTRGYLVMRSYWEDADKTAEAIDAAGWMHTGDLATIDSDGYCNIVGRLKDMIIRGGENIYPREIEEFLYTHPAIADAQVFGVPDDKFGEVSCAWIKLKDGCTLTADELKAYCRERISHQKIPAYVRFVTDYPMTVTGKIRKVEMREVMIRSLNLSEQATA